MNQSGKPVWVTGGFSLTCRSPAGKLRWHIPFLKNTATFQGVNGALDRMFGGGVSPTWYTGLIANGGFSGTQTSDTMALHPGWSEFPGVVSPLRPTLSWNPAGLAIKTTSGSVFWTITGGGLLRGAFITSSQPVGSTAGILYAAAAIDEAYLAAPGEIINASYAVKMEV